MATASVNGVRLFYELHGDKAGDPVVLVHGSWISHHDWDAIVPYLADQFRVLTYDRRGHSQSERPAGQGSVRQDVGDLADLMEHLELTPAWVVGNSFGASISLRLAGERPDLFRGVVAHEPPLFSLLRDEQGFGPLIEDVQKRISAVAEHIASGDHARATEQFVNTVALGPDAWRTIPPHIQEAMIANAPTFFDEVSDPEQLEIDLDQLRRFSKPALLTTGDASPPPFAPVVARLSAAITGAEQVTVTGAGHIPHLTHPKAYAGAIIDFTGRHAT